MKVPSLVPQNVLIKEIQDRVIVFLVLEPFTYCTYRSHFLLLRVRRFFSQMSKRCTRSLRKTLLIKQANQLSSHIFLRLEFPPNWKWLLGFSTDTPTYSPTGLAKSKQRVKGERGAAPQSSQSCGRPSPPVTIDAIIGGGSNWRAQVLERSADSRAHVNTYGRCCCMAICYWNSWRQNDT